MKRCENGHFYDPARNHACPFCTVVNVDLGATRPAALDTDDPIGLDEQATVGLVQKQKGIDPVVGWLVCVAGPDRGRDHRLRVGFNYIGRSREMDVCLAGDETVSRHRHAAVVFDDRKHEFRVVPGEGRDLVYLNGEAVYGPTVLNAYDQLEVGQTRLNFVPFCGERFRWE